MSEVQAGVKELNSALHKSCIIHDLKGELGAHFGST